LDREIRCTKLSETELEVQLLEAHGLIPPSGYKTLDPYLKVTFPFPPEEPQIFTSPKASKTLDPRMSRTCRQAYPTSSQLVVLIFGVPSEFRVSTKFYIDRTKRTLIRTLERKKLLIDVYHSRFLLSDVNVGKLEVDLNSVKEKCETTLDAIPVCATHTHTPQRIYEQPRLC
jgi:hypothetical protein